MQAHSIVFRFCVFLVKFFTDLPSFGSVSFPRPCYPWSCCWCARDTSCSKGDIPETMMELMTWGTCAPARLRWGVSGKKKEEVFLKTSSIFCEKTTLVFCVKKTIFLCNSAPANRERKKKTRYCSTSDLIPVIIRAPQDVSLSPFFRFQFLKSIHVWMSPGVHLFQSESWRTRQAALGERVCLVFPSRAHFF